MSWIMEPKRLQPLPNNQAKMRYALSQGNILGGFTLAPDHAILKCEHYYPEKKKFNQQEFLEWLEATR